MIGRAVKAWLSPAAVTSSCHQQHRPRAHALNWYPFAPLSKTCK
jgi:hypothetical protein